MSNIIIGESTPMQTSIPSALSFPEFDRTKWFTENGHKLNIHADNFEYNPVEFHHVHDTANKKFFALPQGKGNNASLAYADQKPLGCYKYDHQTDTSVFIEFDREDVKNLAKNLIHNSYECLLYDETTDTLLFLDYSTKELWEIDQTTGKFTKKETCTLGGNFGSAVCANGYLYFLNTSKQFARFDITNNSWETLSVMGGSCSISPSYSRLLTDGNWIVFVPYQAMNTANYELKKYHIASKTWSEASISSAPTMTNCYISEIFNGYVYVHAVSKTNNYSSIWKYSLSSNTWQASIFSLRDKGMTNGGAFGMFRANNKLYWYGSRECYDASDNRQMQYIALWEMDTAENFTETDKIIPVEFGEWCYNKIDGKEADMKQVQKSCGRFQFYNSFHSKSRGYRYFPYIDPVGKTVEWVKTPEERDWQGWGAVVKEGKLYMIDPRTCDLFACTIGVWEWEKLDNLFTRMGDKVPFSHYGNQWRYGCAPNYSNGSNACMAMGGLFTVKNSEDIFLVCPRYSSDTYAQIFKFNITNGVWEILNLDCNISGMVFGQNSNESYYNQKNFLAVSNENSLWVLLVSKARNASNSVIYTQKYYTFNATNGTFEFMAGQGTTNWYGVYGFSLEGLPVWQAETSTDKIRMHDMDSMADNDTTQYIEQVLDDADKYIMQYRITDAILVFNIDSENFHNSSAVAVQSSQLDAGVHRHWGFQKMIDAVKGGDLLGFSRKEMTGDTYQARVLMSAEGKNSQVKTFALPETVVDSSFIFKTKIRKNFLLFLESWAENQDIMTYFIKN